MLRYLQSSGPQVYAVGNEHALLSLPGSSALHHYTIRVFRFACISASSIDLFCHQQSPAHFQMRKGINTMHKTELQMITQAVILFLVLASLMTFWHYHQLFLPDSIWTMFAINLYWIMYCGLNPLLYLACSNKLFLKNRYSHSIPIHHFCLKSAATVTSTFFVKRGPMSLKRRIC
ncbi:unnamed protein product [Angiostrongylus costaricensis]|uniref:7TM_GPCR_Srx domain-containing protein n=1 Tax=Angiostrongylus costaricensis TaxID=334426 RepID=A0A0R3PY22_ANGCS|nr:unnamed protein product [Angiostrongylus costaricensis]